MEQFSESEQIEMHISLISGILRKGGDSLFFREMVEQVKQVEWANIDYIKPALQRMIVYGQLKYDQNYDYCMEGRRVLKQDDMSTPGMYRDDFDKLTPTEKWKYIFQDGGYIKD